MIENTSNTIEWKIFDISQFTEEDFEKWHSLMSAEKQKRVDRFRLSEDKVRTVAGEMLARQMISQRCGVAPEEITFRIAKNGKPYAEGLNVHFNISHSGDFVACAVDSKPVGIDVEKVRPIDCWVMKAVCSSRELSEISILLNDGQKITDEAALQIFFQAWTKREAVFKSGLENAEICYPEISRDYVLCIACEK